MMNWVFHSRFGEPLRRTTRLIPLTLTLAVAPVLAARAEDGSAQAILKTMSDYVAKQGNLSLKYDSDIEIITPAIEKIQFSASGDVVMSRPNKARVSRTGGYADVELVFDGNTVSVLDKDKKRFAQVQAPGSFDEVVDRLRAELGVDMPGADLLRSKVYDELTDGVLEAKHIGRGVVDGVECEHLAFRNEDTDWQIWIEAGERPIPRKYVITSKTIAAAPQYTLRVRDWKTDQKPDPNVFAFQPPEGASRVELKMLTDIDEVPSGIVAGGRK